MKTETTVGDISGVHNPSPYLRRYRLPTINSSATVAAYEELLSPVENCAKFALISSINFQNKHFSEPANLQNNSLSIENNVEQPDDNSNSNRTVASAHSVFVFCNLFIYEQKCHYHY
ncbi:unnamed protein product [Gongylonema pulchrum]|uniref:Uncharacterized protein n=1 Tax=Gongylonema pulchrum TaxID=637853 RepID=A0A183D5J9_9BILA|nr:unnamed protein product [Gongylonema pulchrum]